MSTMLRATRFSAMTQSRVPLFLAAGFFDGVHRGHQRVITAARKAARAAAGQLWALTFNSHPLKILTPERAPLLLTTAEHKARWLERLGVDGCLSLPFDARWAALEPLAFLDHLLQEAPDWKALFVGTDWRFGRSARGDVATLRQWAADHGVYVNAVPPVICDGRPVSSTRIREAVASGRLTIAARLLGRPFSLMGTVRRGRGIGRRLGYPTANLDPDNEVQPPYGVYAAALSCDDGRMMGGVLNLGIRPTFADGEVSGRPLIEIHLLDQTPDLYGREVEVFFLGRLRAERRFADAAALRRQISVDVETARRVLSKKSHLRALQMLRHDIHFDPIQGH